MDKALLVNIILAGLTGVYVTLTFFLLRNTYKQNKIIVEQLRVNSLPLFECEIMDNPDKKSPKILIKNIGDIPAFDLDIYISGILFDDDIPKKELIEKYILKKKRSKIKNVSLIEDGQYGIYERGIYPNLPSKRQIDYQTDYKVPIDQFEILLQYRDYTGNNYAQVFWFFKDKDETKFKFGLMKPVIPKIIDRFDLTDEINLNDIPKDFHMTIMRIAVSIHANYIKETENDGVESRWNII